MKKLFALTLALLMLLPLVGCSKTEQGKGPQDEKEITVYLPATCQLAWETKFDSQSHTYSYEYDDRGRCISIHATGIQDTYGEKVDYERQLSRVFDEKGNLVEETEIRKYNQNGVITEGTTKTQYAYTYDQKGRPTQLTVTTINDGNPGNSKTYDFTYDAKGNLIQAFQEDYAYYFFKYDLNNRLVAEYKATLIPTDATMENMVWRYIKVTYSYDNHSRVSRAVSYAGNHSVLLTYALLDTVPYQPAHEYYGFPSSELFDLSFLYDQQGRLIQMGVSEYTYDENGHLVRPNYSENYMGQERYEHYACDENGNVTRRETHNQTDIYTYVKLTLTESDTRYAQRQFGIPIGHMRFYDPSYGLSLEYPACSWLESSRNYFPEFYYWIPNPVW